MAHYNERGVIAEMYADLQAIPVLEAALEAYPLPTASAESTLRAVFQAAEVALLNLSDLVARAASDIESQALGPAVVKLSWARGFHRVMLQISLLPHQLGLACDAVEAHGVLRIADSPAFQEYVAALKRFDATLLQRIEARTFPIVDVIAHESLDSNRLKIVHLSRVSNHEASIWERNLAEIFVPAFVPGYQEFVVAQGMREAVYDRVLKGDVYFTQFRGLHQVPEILCFEVNDHIETAILDVRAGRLQQAHEHLSRVNILMEAIVSSLPPMADNLVTSDYHQIRENLGLTSGSHSVSLHYHLFRDLYQQLADALAGYLVDNPKKGGKNGALLQTLRQVAQRRFEELEAYLFHLLINESLRLRSYINQWRDAHLHLPRNNLGGSYTKSLTGSPDAIKAVRSMRDAARARDAMRAMAEARALQEVPLNAENTPLTHYFDTEASLDQKILEATGVATQERFHNVQDRLGFFANKCPFTPPPKRKV